jgi:uncharacterized protein YqeY
MLLIEKIKKDRITAMKQKDEDAKSILSTLLGEVESLSKRNGTEISDELIIQTCKKFIANINETLTHADSENQVSLLCELEILEQFLPAQLSAAELRNIIASFGSKNLGEIMKHLKENYNGQYDGKVASAVAREFV